MDSTALGPKKDDQAVSASNVNHLSLDCKATVKSGEFARGGLTCSDNLARDHDMGSKETYVPCGIVEEASGELPLTFGSSSKTSNFIDAVMTKFGDSAQDRQ